MLPKRTTVIILRRRGFLRDGAKAWDLRWGPETNELGPAYAQDFKYATRLVFEDKSGNKQFYHFMIIRPLVENVNEAPRVITEGDLAIPKPWPPDRNP